jgi:hypothetical protein
VATLCVDRLEPAPVSVRPALALEVGSPAEKAASGQLADPGLDLRSAHILRVGPPPFEMLLANSTGSGWVRHEPDEG